MTPVPPSFAGDPVPAVREVDATGPVAAIFADLRATLGVPLVNLVWRHLATMPAALDWCWSSVKPLYASGAVAGEMGRMHARMVLPDVPRLPAAALRAVGLDATAEGNVAAMLRSYDRGNSMNLLAFMAMLARLDGAPAGTAPQRADLPPLAGDLLPLLDLARMEPPVAELAVALNRIGQPGGVDGPILASLYRHLAHWPAYMALAWTVLEPLDRRGDLAAAIATTRSAAQAGGRALLAEMPAARDEPGPEARAFVRAGLSLFADHGIARMTTVGRLLLAAHPES
ncbi:hypothetical protein EDC65_0372 [Stella humosa]|uniref:Uncharacterized protein n=1 Tax=Stella humosa TaxID=94 RepID=A0A3N1M107_9PROT|nr:hypothetical protein [Stella humosa]ROQ01194.1 hypothetical protein EDC65_0372 [Stella humosa]BBK31568.1 hypothetical protein STHU_22020 [Stella humosa]